MCIVHSTFCERRVLHNYKMKCHQNLLHSEWYFLHRDRVAIVSAVVASHPPSGVLLCPALDPGGVLGIVHLLHPLHLTLAFLHQKIDNSFLVSIVRQIFQ